MDAAALATNFSASFNLRRSAIITGSLASAAILRYFSQISTHAQHSVLQAMNVS
jgi:hypothetical protein